MIAVVLALTAGPAVAQRGNSLEVARHGWLTDYRQAKEAAAKTGKPIFLYFRCVP